MDRPLECKMQRSNSPGCIMSVDLSCSTRRNEYPQFPGLALSVLLCAAYDGPLIAAAFMRLAFYYRKAPCTMVTDSRSRDSSGHRMAAMADILICIAWCDLSPADFNLPSHAFYDSPRSRQAVPGARPTRSVASSESADPGPAPLRWGGPPFCLAPVTAGDAQAGRPSLSAHLPTPQVRRRVS